MSHNKVSFASDNNSGCHPLVLKSIEAWNGVGDQLGYGDDAASKLLQGDFDRVFGDGTMALLCFNGTGTNTVALATVLRRYQAVICSSDSHLALDE